LEVTGPTEIAKPSPTAPQATEPVVNHPDQTEVGPASGQPEALASRTGEEAPRADVAEQQAPRTDLGPDDSEVLSVGRGIRLVAKLCECSELLIEGHLEATARARQIQVAKSGRFIGSAEVEYAEIHGHCEGELTVSEKLYVSRTGRVSGTTHYREIVIEAGGQIMGTTHLLPAAEEEDAEGAEA
jgi:cytoskeletal protein CcmA (bactofilin family)